MKHCNFSELISSYIDGELDPQASAQLEEHLKVCPDCKAMYEELRHIKELLGSVTEIEPPDSLHFSIMEAVNQEAIRREDALRAERSGKRSMWLRRLSIALAACLIILVVSPAVKSTFFGSQQLPRDVTPKIGQEQEETITADNTETEEEGTLVFGSQPQQPEPSVGNGQKQEDVQPPSEKSPSDVTASSEDNELLASDATSGVPEEEISEGDEATEFFMATKRTAANIAKEIKSANIAIEVPQGVLGDVSDKACAMIGESGGSVHLCFESVYAPTGASAFCVTALVPSSGVEQVSDDISALGSVVQSDVIAYDVTAYRNVLDSLVETNQMHRDNLAQAIINAVDAQDVSLAQEELLRLDELIAALNEERELLDELCDHASIWLWIIEVKEE